MVADLIPFQSLVGGLDMCGWFCSVPRPPTSYISTPYLLCSHLLCAFQCGVGNLFHFLCLAFPTCKIENNNSTYFCCTVGHIRSAMSPDPERQLDGQVSLSNRDIIKADTAATNDN